MSERAAYCLQTFISAGRGVAPGKVLTFGDRPQAVAEGERRARRAAGAAVYEFEGDAATQVWSDPKEIARFGRIG